MEITLTPSQKYYNKNKDKVIAASTKWRKENNQKKLAINKKYQQKNKDKINIFNKKYRLKRKYNITLEDYDALFEKQNGKCAICHLSQENLNKELSVDHCHTTGKIRGLLCHNCNTSLGLLKDNPEIIKNLLTYISNNI